MKKFKTAVLGCGAISDIYLQNLKERYAVIDLVGCSDINAELAQAKAAAYGIKAVSMEEIKNDRSIDIVVNLTPPQLHYVIIKELLLAGKNVYTEKVLAPNFAEAGELVALAQAKGLVLCAAPDTFLGAGIQTGKYVLEQGMIGEPTSCVAILQRDSRLLAEKFPFTARPGGGIGIDVGIYYATALINLLGNVTEVSGIVRTREPERRHYFAGADNFGEAYEMQAETLLAGTVRFANEVIVSLHFNSDSIRSEKPFLTIYGTEGILYLPDPNCFGGAVKVQLKGQTEAFAFPPTHAYADNCRGLGVAEMAWSMSRSAVPRTNAAMALHALEMLSGITTSSETKQIYHMTTAFTMPEGLPRGYLGEDYGGAQPEGGLTI